MNRQGHILTSISVVAMAIWLSAGLFHPVMQAHPQPDFGLTEGLSHNHVLLDPHPVCPFCFGVLALPSDDPSFQVIRTLQFEQPELPTIAPVVALRQSPISNRAPPVSNG